MLEILVKSTIIWLVWYLVYLLFLKYNTSYFGRRLYLYTAIISGLLLPLMTMPFDIGWNNNPGLIIENPIVANINNPNTKNEIVTITLPTIDWISIILWIIYGIGVLVMLIKTLREILFLTKAIKSAKIKNGNVYYSDAIKMPLSFFGKILLPNTSNFSEAEQSMIIHHESAHNHYKHYIDIVFIQFFQIVFWFHPLIWMYKKLFTLVHENEADAIASQDTPYKYAQLLLKTIQNKQQPILAHSFYYSPIKNRITMLSNNSKNNKWALLLAIPMLAFSMLAMKSKGKGIMYNMDKSSGITKKNGVTIKWEFQNRFDTIEVFNPEYNEWDLRIEYNENIEFATFLNNDILQSNWNYNNDEYTKLLNKEIKENLGKEKIQTNEIVIKNVVIDNKGRIQYYDTELRAKVYSGIEENNEVDHLFKLINNFIENNPTIKISPTYKSTFYKTFVYLKL